MSVERLGRRRFVILAAVALTACVAAVVGSRGGRRGIKSLLALLFPEPALDRASGVGTLPEPAMATLLALVEVLLPAAAVPASAEGMREHIARRAAEEAGWAAEYSAAAQTLDAAAAPATFAALAPPERDRVLHSLFWSYGVGDRRRRQLEELWLSRRCRALRELVIRDLLGAFYASPRGWAVVGYTHYPGVPAADARDYASRLSA